MLREESGGGKKSYPVGSPEWIREQKLLADQRNRQRILDKQKQTAPRPTGHLEPEEIPLPSGDTATRNPVNITPIPRPTGQLRPEEIPLPSGDTATQNPVIDPSLYPGIDLLSDEQLHSLLAYTGPMPDKSDEMPRDELQNILLNWKYMQFPGKVSTRGYDIEMRDNKYSVTNGDNTALFPFAEDAINYVYGTSAINNNNGDLLTRYFSRIADNLGDNLQKLAAGEEKRKEQIEKANEDELLRKFGEIPPYNPLSTLAIAESKGPNTQNNEFTMGPTDGDAKSIGLNLESGNLTYSNLDELKPPKIIDTSDGPAFSYVPNSISDENSEEWTTTFDPPPFGDTKFDWANFMATGFDSEVTPATDKWGGVEGAVSGLTDALYGIASSIKGLDYKVTVQENNNNDQRLIISGSYRVQRGNETGDMYAHRPGTLIEALHLFWNKAEEEHTLDNSNGMISWTDLLDSYYVDVNSTKPEDEIVQQMSIPDRIITEKVLGLSDLMTDENGDALKVYISFDEGRLNDTDTFYCYFDKNGDAYAQLRLLPGERVYINNTIQKDSPWRAPWEKSNMQLQDITELFLEPYPLNDIETEYLKSCMEQALAWELPMPQPGPSPDYSPSPTPTPRALQ